MKATNQGFIDLASPLGVVLIMVSIVLLGGIIIAGAVVTRAIEAENRRKRAALKAQMQADAEHRAEAVPPRPAP